ncbi:hypothetical protein V6N13_005190 [Hibiscus sabdariffa]
MLQLWYVRQHRLVVSKFVAGISLFIGHDVLDILFTSILGGICAIFCVFSCKSVVSQMTLAACTSNMYVVAYGGILHIYTIWNLEDNVLFAGRDNAINRESSDAMKDHIEGGPNEETKISVKMRTLCGLFSFQGLGVRKHGMGAICNDIAFHHQPNEYMTSFRAIPNLLMLHLVDGKERTSTYEVILVSKKKPYILVIPIQIELVIVIEVVDKLMREFHDRNLEDKVLFPGDGSVMNRELRKGYEILDGRLPCLVGVYFIILP